MSDADVSAIRVLVVDDEALVAFDVADQCEAAGFEVIGPALTLNQGLVLAESNASGCSRPRVLRLEMVHPPREPKRHLPLMGAPHKAL